MDPVGERIDQSFLATPIWACNGDLNAQLYLDLNNLAEAVVGVTLAVKARSFAITSEFPGPGGQN